jgi:hypothetical protein
VTSRRRTGRFGNAARTIAYDAFDHVVDADLLRGQRGQPDAERTGDREPGATGDAAAPAPHLRQRRVERGQALRRSRRGAVGRADAGPVGGAFGSGGRRRRLDRPLVDLADLIRDAGPGVALSASPRRLAHRGEALGLVMGALQLLGEPLRVAGRDEDAVDAVADDVAVAGDRRGDRRGAGGKRLGQDHAEALARERGGAEHVGLVQRPPEPVFGDATADLDPAQRLRVGEVTQHVVAFGADHCEAGGDVLDQRFEGAQQDRQALALLRPADEQHAQLPADRLRPARSGVDVDPVGDYLVVAAEPATAGPGGRLGDRDPRREPVEDAPRPEGRGDVVRDRLGRVGVEGADDGSARAEGRVPADQRHDRLVHVDDVEIAAAKLAPRGEDAAGREGSEVGDRAVGGEARRAAQRHEVVGRPPLLRRRPVKRPAEPVGRVEGSENANVMAAAEELLGKRLHMPVHAALVAPGIWRDESDSHE